MAAETRKESGYAVGVQEFDRIRKSQAVYVDKTEYVWKMVSTNDHDAITKSLQRENAANVIPRL